MMFGWSEQYTASFPGVPAGEFYRYVSKVCGVNFLGSDDLFNFTVHFVASNPTKASDLLEAALENLKDHGLYAEKMNNCYLIKRIPLDGDWDLAPAKGEKEEFFTYKLQYQNGAEILEAIRRLSSDISKSPFLAAIQSIQWIKTTQTLLFKGIPEAAARVSELVRSLDVPLKQVFIEVLVIETSVHHSLEFGVDWSFSSALGKGAEIATSTPGAVNLNPKSGSNCFNLGVFGNILLYKGRIFSTLSSLISALEADHDATILLNQKIMTQENKASAIFSGDTLPFAGSKVETVGSSQQTTSNIEYKDIGVNLVIIPVLGDEDVISLDITQEISRQLETAQSGGLSTSKTNIHTSVHVPDNHFLLLSGMTKESHSSSESGLPCLGGIPFLGSLFGKKGKIDSKKNILIFVRPHIVKKSTFSDADAAGADKKELGMNHTENGLQLEH